MSEEEVAIEIYEEDLTVIHDTLASVYHFSLSYDLFNQYKNLSNSVQLSPLTKQVKTVMTRVQGILDDAAAQLELAQADEESTTADVS